MFSPTLSISSFWQFLAPEHTIRPSLEFYYHLGLNDIQIESNMKDHYDTDQYGLRYATMLSQFHTDLDNNHYLPVSPASNNCKKNGIWNLHVSSNVHWNQLRARFRLYANPIHLEEQKWYESSSGLILESEHLGKPTHPCTIFLSISYQCREVIMTYLKRTEPDAVQACCHWRFKCRRFHAAGVSDVWCLNQHDKWGPRFGLWLHNCIDSLLVSITG